MAIFGLGSYYRGKDVTKKFIEHGIACIGWDENDAPTLFNVMKTIQVGDIIYLKSYPIRSGLRIKAIGIVNSTKAIDEKLKNDFGRGIHVQWLVSDLPVTEFSKDKYNVRRNTLYEEYSEEIQQYVINMIFQHFNS